MIKFIITAMALSALVLGPATADTTTTTPVTQTMPSGGGFLQQQTTGELRSTKLIGAKVMGANNQNIGEINDIVIDQNGGIQAVVVGVGGFLGLGQKNVAIPYKNLTVTRGSTSDSIERVSVDYTKDQLNSAPSYKYLASNS